MTMPTYAYACQCITKKQKDNKNFIKNMIMRRAFEKSDVCVLDPASGVAQAFSADPESGVDPARKVSAAVGTLKFKNLILVVIKILQSLFT
jgi:hypothetical protein